MDNMSYISKAEEIMEAFALETGISETGKALPVRYLWTDAFAVCNYLGFYRWWNDKKYLDLALALVDQVHGILGRHRGDDQRTGWISGLDEEEGKLHPTKWGLRIGKEMNERGPEDPLDERLEWDRDGQYYHYLTKWMHALNSLGRLTGDFVYNRWAVELAKTAHAGFVYRALSGATTRMYWKMSIDLSYPLVKSMGHHDPLDGFITYKQLEETLSRDPQKQEQPDLFSEIADLAQICKGKSWATDDPLGIGGLLSDAFRVAQLIMYGGTEKTGLLETILKTALGDLRFYGRNHPLNLDPEYRLAFRELGLSIGLRAVEKLMKLIMRYPELLGENGRLQGAIDGLMKYVPLSEVIETFWLDPKNQEAASFKAHRNINMVMLATSLAPDGYLILEKGDHPENIQS